MSLNARLAAARKAVDALEGELAAAYAKPLRAAASTATSRFRAVAVVAAANPKWTPPTPGELVDGQKLAANGNAHARPIHERALRATADAAVGVSFDVTNPYAVGLLDGVAARSAQILAGYGGELQATIREAYEQGLSVADAAKLIEARAEDASRVMAELLARTDLNSIANGGSLLMAQLVDAASAEAGEPGVGAKTWVTAGDERVRPDHAEADGQAVPLDQPFDVGGEQLMYPGDPQGSLEQIANCRCVVVYGGGAEIASAGPEVSTLAMVAVYPRAEESDALAVPGGLAPDELHCTLLFLGDAVNVDAEALAAAVADVAQTLPPLEGAVGGAAHFAEGPDGYPSILLPDVMGLSTLQERIRSGLMKAGVESPSEHGFLPHMTLTYASEPAVPDSKNLGADLHFDAVTTVVGGERTDYPLTGMAITAAVRAPTLALSSRGTMDETPEVTTPPLLALRDFHLTAAAGEPTRWQATLLVEGEPTEDGRMIEAGATTWRALPLPLAFMDDSMHAEADEAPVVGRIDQIWRAGNLIQAAGVFNDAATPPDLLAIECVQKITDRMITGISVDPVGGDCEIVVTEKPTAETDESAEERMDGIVDDTVVEVYDDDLEYLMVYTELVIGGATVCPQQAVAQARIQIVAGAEADLAPFAAAFEATVCEVPARGDGEPADSAKLEALTASVEAMTTRSAELAAAVEERLGSVDAQQRAIIAHFVSMDEQLKPLASIPRDVAALRESVERKPRHVEFKRDGDGRLAGLVEER